jgi:hypothetical protein
MLAMPEVYPVTVQLYGRCPQYPDGKVTSGFFTFVDGVVTISQWNGVTAEDPQGRVYTRKLTSPHDTFADAEIAAKILFRDFRLSVLGKTPSSEKFSGPINYRKKGWC